MRRIKNRGKLKKEGLIISILKSEGSNAERNYMKHFNINSNVNNNNKLVTIILMLVIVMMSIIIILMMMMMAKSEIK